MFSPYYPISNQVVVKENNFENEIEDFRLEKIKKVLKIIPKNILVLKIAKASRILDNFFVKICVIVKSVITKIVKKNNFILIAGPCVIENESHFQLIGDGYHQPGFLAGLNFGVRGSGP